MSETLTTLIQLQNKVESQVRDECDRHQKKLAKLNDEANSIAERIGLAKEGLDLAMAALAETVVRVTGDVATYVGTEGVRHKARKDAIKQIADSDMPMVLEYIGVKNYSDFGDQREDHKYGYGPRHGSIIFRIESICRLRDWTDEERDAAIYYLLNLEAIQSVKREVAAA